MSGKHSYDERSLYKAKRQKMENGYVYILPSGEIMAKSTYYDALKNCQKLPSSGNQHNDPNLDTQLRRTDHVTENDCQDVGGNVESARVEDLREFILSEFEFEEEDEGILTAGENESFNNEEEENEFWKTPCESSLTFQQRLRQRIRTLACDVSSGITREVGNALLKLLREIPAEELPELKNLPVDFRTIMYMDAPSFPVTDVNPGKMVYFGIKSVLSCPNRTFFNKNKTRVELTINVDGLPLKNSSGVEFWPILGRVEDYPVFVIAVWCGMSKPQKSNDFLRQFVDEVKHLNTQKLKISGNEYDFSLVKIMADAVAKAWILNIKAPTGYGCCTRCNSYGVYERGRVCFPEIGELRTDEAFRQEDDDSEKTVLIEIPNFDLVKGIPLDYMHLVCIGVMKRLLQVWTGNRTDHSERRLLGTNMMRKVNLRLQRIGSQYSPCEFARKPRSLKWLANWKSSEYRQFLLYYGPAVLQGVLPEKYFDNFILFHVSIRILTSRNLVQSSTALKLADGYLNKFVDEAQQLYGRHFAVHNVHSLVHLPSDVQRYGVLDNFSCFPFENFLFKIKKVIRGGNEPLKQFINRYNEWLSVQEPSESCQKDSEISYILRGPLKKDNLLLDNYHQYRYIQNENETFKTDSQKDCYAFLTDKCFAKICQIRQHKVTGEVSFLVKRIKKIENLYSNPVTSMQVGECVVNLTLLEKEIPIVIKIDNISKKCYVMPYKDTITDEKQTQELYNHSLHVASSFRH